MHKVILFVCFSASLSILSAIEPPERVFPLSMAIHSIDYYTAQMESWRKELDTDKDNATAWLNYYTAARNSNVLAADDRYDLDEILADVQANIPATFEAYYIEFWNSDFFDRNYTPLLKAHELAPDRWEVYHDLIIYYKTINDQAAVKKYTQLLYESGRLSAGILEWNYNALMSVESKSILLTNGDNDTYPAWVLQEVKSIRPDVEVLNIYLLLASDSYREAVFKSINIPNTYSNLPHSKLENQLKALVNHLLKYSQQPVYFGVATPANLRTALGDNLYLTGLAFQHNPKQVDNIARLDYYYQNRFRLESLKTPLAFDASQSVVDHINMNYIPSFALLYRHYDNNNREAEATATQALITQIATRADKLESVEYLFDDENEIEEIKKESVLNIKNIDKAFLQVSSGLYAAQTEVSNAEYKFFLHDLLNQNKFEALEISRIHPTNWIALLAKEYQGLSNEVYYKQGHPEQDEGPIVNITFEAAQYYCQWLTEQYNQSDYKKKRFKKVVFRLPSKDEWKQAAYGGRDNTPFPWDGPYSKNAKGCLLANFNPSVELTKESTLESTGVPGNEDGSFFPVKVDAYYPNDLGFYNMAGNVAEMIDEEGNTMGGGWNDPSYYMQIGVVHEVNLPNPNTGFRVFMDVIEE